MNHRIAYELSEQKSQRSFARHAPYNKRSTRRHTIGGINAGVSHGIKRPKLKARSAVAKNSISPPVKSNITGSVKRKATNSMTDITNFHEESYTVPIERSSSPEIDLCKRFFKTKETSMRNGSSTVTINKNVKLQVAQSGEFILSKKNNRPKRQVHKQSKPVEISFDTTDLLVDEPDLEATMEQHDVANIFKILDDWADDDYDEMETLTNQKFDNISIVKPLSMLQDDAISPANELSNEASTVNITDISIPQTFKNIFLDDENNGKENEQKYFPIFNKGYSANKVIDDIDKKSMHSKKESMNWQLSVKRNGNENQYQIDAGQNNFGATQCTECGIIYQIGDPEDENAHLNYHNNRKRLKFLGWKTERVIMEDPITSSRVILVEPDDPKQYWNKVTDILEYVDKDLGLVNTNLSDYENKKVYLYIRDKTILGVLVAERISTAYRMIPELLELNCCTAESIPAKCGINVVWTDMNHRRQGIATKLIDILRSQFYYGYIMSLDDIAFSIPTTSGKIFAEKYTKTRNFKVYS